MAKCTKIFSRSASSARSATCLALALVTFFATLPVLADGVAQPGRRPTLFESGDYPPFLIGPGDILSVFIYGESEGNVSMPIEAQGVSGGTMPAQAMGPGNGFPLEYKVDSSGMIVVPLAGPILVAGLTQTQAGAEVAKHLLPFERNPQVTVLIEDSATYAVSVLGEVNKPGKYQIRGKADLIDMLAAAGGLTEHADLNKAVLIRGDKRILMPLGTYLLDRSSTAHQPVLYPGDALMVPMSHWPSSFGDWGTVAGIFVGIVIAVATVSEAEYQRTH